MRWQFRHWLITLIVLSSPLVAQGQNPVALAPSLHPQYVDGTGKPLSGGFLYSYQAGTTTLQSTYADPLGVVANPNPIPLDSTGAPSNGSTQVQVWLLNSSYKICAFNSALVQAWCWDNVSAYQIITSLPNLTFNGVTADPTPFAGETWYRSDIPCFRGYTTFADCFSTLTGIQTLTNKTLTSPIITSPAINGVTPSVTAPTIGQVYTATTPSTAAFQSRVISIPFIIDGAGSTITTGSKGFLQIPFNCSLVSWTLLADQLGSIVIDVKSSTYAGFPTTNTITGGDKPTLIAQQKNQNPLITQWAGAVTAGNVLEFTVNSATTVTRVTLSITATLP